MKKATSTTSGFELRSFYATAKRGFLLFTLMILSILGSSTAKADNNENAALYMVMQAGMNQLKFEMPVYDAEGYDGWVDQGYIYVTPKGGSRLTLLHYYSRETDDTYPKAWLSKGVDGLLTLRRDRNYSNVTITTSEKGIEIPSVPGTDYCKLYLTWTVPDELRGKELTISWKVHKTGNMTEWSEDVEINDSKISFPALPDQVRPDITEPILGYDVAHAGQMMFIYTMTSNDIKSLTAHYNEVNGQHVTHKSMPVDPKMSGYIYLDADKCYTDFYIDAVYTDTESKLRTTRSDSLTIPTLHFPAALAATLQPDGTVLLTWSTRNPRWNDISDGDTWELQRNISGTLNADSQWQTFGQVAFLNKDTTYTYTDPSFLQFYEGKTVYYRVRRTSTSAWNWATGTYAQTSLSFPVSLPKVTSARVKQSKWAEGEHKADFTFETGMPAQDSQGRYLLGSVQDWEYIVRKVNDGTSPVNVIMTADVDISGTTLMMGQRQVAPYTGTFDGNGHTLTFNPGNWKDDYVAPFRYVKGATVIKNLRVQGSINTGKKFAAGLVGMVTDESDQVLIESCQSSVNITSRVKGDGTNGGLVANAMNCKNLILRNCLFDGSIAGEECYNNGGMVGWSYGKVLIENSIFNPSLLGTKLDGCRTFARTSNGDAEIIKSYYTMPYDGISTTTIDAKKYHIVRNSSDWDAIRQTIASSTDDVNIILDGSFQTTAMLGTSENPYHGIFEGNGHTITVDLNSTEDFIGPFNYVNGTTTIRNLNIQGKVAGKRHSSGLVGFTDNQATLTIENCHVSAHVITRDYYAGGFIGHANNGKHIIRNCLFDGTLESTEFDKTSYAGSIIGWEEGGTTNEVSYCLEHATYISFNHSGFCYRQTSAYGNNGTSHDNYSFMDWTESYKASGMDAITLAGNLGDGWQTWSSLVIPKQETQGSVTIGQGIDASEMTLKALRDTIPGQWEIAGNSLVPVITISANPEHKATVWDSKAKVVLYIDKYVDEQLRYTERSELTADEFQAGRFSRDLFTSCVDHTFRLMVEKGSSLLPVSDSLDFYVIKTEAGEAARYHFDNNVLIYDLKADTMQTAVSLSWKTKGTGDFFRIIRQDKMENRADTLEHNYILTAYVDRTPRPQHAYTYTVEGVNQCETEHISRATVSGGCRPTGMVRGYVRLADGTAMAGVTVKAEPASGEYEGAVIRTAVTDETGFFEIDGLIYQGAASYQVSVEMGGDMPGVDPRASSFDDFSNLVTNLNFIQRRYYIFSGQVIYEGTSVPVVGAQFERDGVLVKNGSGQPVTTDSQGNFELSIPQGSHTVRVVKDGHVFADNGFYLDPDAAGDDKRKHNWQKEEAGYIFWDQTRVTLRGRVVGGDVQGDKPLGQSASVNNLGDSLTIIMQLEGDNASYLVRDQLDGDITELHYNQPVGPVDTCQINMYRHRIVIHPSNTTGEYMINLPPVKFKITEVYAQGYPTLFQTGQVGQTVDLSDLVNADTATWNRIYHVAPTLDVKQFNMMGETYMGIKSYTDLDNTGKSVSIELWNDSTRTYSFGYPVFMAGSPVIMTMAAVEQYYYNNDQRTATPDVVHLPGGSVEVQNGLIGTTDIKNIALDSIGEATYSFTPQNYTLTQEGDMALKTLTMTLLYDGTYYDIKPMSGQPIRGYVMAAQTKPQGRRTVQNGGTYLIDILRDPPGSGSSAYIESGSKMSYSFNQSVKAEAGLKLTFGTSAGGVNMFEGVWAGVGGGSFIGDNMSVKNQDQFGIGLVTTYYNSWQYSYTFENGERISTSSGATSVGRDADVFIGMTQVAIMEDVIAVRAVDQQTYDLLTTHAGGTFTVDGIEYNVPLGTMKLLAQGQDGKGNNVYLIRDEALGFKTELQSTFIHSQLHIEKELIPNLIKLRNQLILPQGTSQDLAKEIANNKEHAMFISDVPADDPNFGVEGFYTQVDPDNGSTTDSISDYNNRIRTWIGFLIVNEKEKLEATDLVKRYDIDGRSSVSYGESFSTSSSESRYWLLPFFDGLGSLSFPGVGNIGGGGAKTGSSQYTAPGDEGKYQTMSFDMFGSGLYIKIAPVLSLDYNWNYGGSEGQSKKAGFSLSLSAKSNMVVEVYRTKMDMDEIRQRAQAMEEAGYENPEELFFQFASEEYIDYVKNGAGYGKVGSMSTLSYVSEAPTQYRSFVYRTKGGATVAPFEDERKTKYYMPGTVLDEKTLPIDNLRIWADQQSVSNVPYDEPARFTIHMANESEVPNMTTPAFVYFLDDETNKKGAKVLVDGAPATGSGNYVSISANVPVTKQVEIYPGAEFDYDNIGLCIWDPNDVKRIETVYLSAHFVPTAGKVNISLPGDKWVINTESQFNTERQQYYMPVRIDGFDVNYRGFDHIELQYKLSTQGDKEWVNVCSYYKDSLLFAKSNGVSKMIEDDGQIMAQFFGEIDPVEQSYDLRAVCYCRHGEGFLTRSSKILTGIKDTRRPQLFGTPKPEDGILDIGDDIILRFSEPIAGNYLRPLNNFEILGQTNSNNITLSTALHFNGDFDCATSMSSRNLSGKAFTVDVMVNPKDTAQGMTVFSHGSGNHQLELGLTADRKLSALFIIRNGNGLLNNTDSTRHFLYESTEAIPFNGMRSIRYVLAPNALARTTTVIFYDGTREIGRATHPYIYNGSGPYMLGIGKIDGTWREQSFIGDMLEFRLWNHALTMDEMSDYSMKHLNGYELGLLDNYPLSEGKGAYSFNQAIGGSDLHISGATWKVPDGIGIKLDGEKGFRLNSDKFTRWSHEDYTLMFWFRTTDMDGTLLANGLSTDESGYSDHFNFYVKNGNLGLHLGGMTVNTTVRVTGGDWHHAALTVSRSRNAGCIYVDQQLYKTFTVDTIGGILGGYLAAGATYTGPNTAVEPISGHIDEIALFEMALPENSISDFAGNTPTGEEMGLMVYLNFSRNELQSTGGQRLMPTGISLKRYKDEATGQLTTERDTIVAQDVVDELADRTIYAPMRDTQQLENIRYSFVADGKDLLINLNVPNERIEKTNVYVVVKDVADLNGNTMASPAVMNLYVYRNPLRWDVKRLAIDTRYGEEYTFDATIRNLSGKSRRFNLDGLPLWMTVSETSGTVEPLDEYTITFTISPYINIGDFDEVINLIGEDGMNEPLPISISVRGELPEWAGATDQLKETNITMNVVASVEIGGQVMDDPDDRLAVFGENHQLLGVTSMDADETQIGGALAYLTIYNRSREATPLTYEYYDASTGLIYRLLPDENLMYFKPDVIVGTVQQPAQLTANNGMVQTLNLTKGWNWISFNVWPDEVPVEELMNNATKWEAGDGLEIIKPDGTYEQIFYKEVYNSKDPENPTLIWDNSTEILDLDPTLMYRFYSNSDKVAYFAGFQAYESIEVKPGWNRVGYLSTINLPIGTALAEYTDKARAGDIIKNQDEFSMLTVDSYGNKVWKGTLKYMRSGEGYMIKYNGTDSIEFSYPTYYGESRYRESSQSQQLTSAFRNTSATSMTVVATALGVDVQPGDVITAWRGAEPCGMAVADDEGLFYLNVGDADVLTKDLSFTLERDERIIASTASKQMTYMSDAALGAPDNPTAIDFVSTDAPVMDGWYDLGGRRYEKSRMSDPSLPSGIFINDNKKQIFK